MTGHESTSSGPGRLDEVMLAMDVVDTLRHQQDLVEHALAEDVRDAALIERIRSIYSNQGIEVTDAIVAEGVEALKKDRFVYRPPPPSFRLRIARLYVRRGIWFRRVIVIGVLVLGVWLLHDIRGGMSERSRDAEIQDLIATARQRVDAATSRLTIAQRDVQSLSAPAGVGPAAERLRDAAMAEHARAAQSIQQARDRLATVVEPASSRDRGEVERALGSLSAPLTEADQALGRGASGLGELRQLVDVHDALQRIQARFAGLDLVPAAAAEARGLLQQAQQAMAVGDVGLARTRVERLEAIATAVNLSYELHIVSRPDEQTGVWRQPADNPRARNYYIIVDAIGPDGRPVTLPVTSEEDRSTRMVSTFGIRVPEQVFEAVRADKMANGLIDDPLFAVKRRGALEPEYRRAVAGGMITSW